MRRILILGIFLTLLAGCSPLKTTPPTAEEGLQVVVTTTMLQDLVEELAGEHLQVTGLCAAGVDPHLYQATAGDMLILQQADVVVYHGFHLEGKLGDILSQLEQQGKYIICLEDGISPEGLLLAEEEVDGGYDPHIWFDVSLWMEAAVYVAECFMTLEAEHTQVYQQNLERYLLELETLDAYIQEKVAEIPAEKRILITAHDAFHYFGKAYGFQVYGIQGTSTESEASTWDISSLANRIVTQEIRSIFVETSIAPKTMEALQEAVASQGFQVAIGGALYSDSLGDATSGHDSYCKAVKSNIDTLVEGLR